MSAALLAAGIAQLGKVLREHGIAVGIEGEIDGVRALGRLAHADREEARCALKVALRIRRGDWERFDAILDGLWSGPRSNPVAQSPTASIDGKRPGRSPAEPGWNVEPEGTPGGDGSAAGTFPGYSPAALLRKKPLETCTPAELVAMERVLARLAARLATRRSRRLVPTRGRGAPDPRRSLRRAVGTGGELLSLARRARALERPRLVFLCDTSGSMEPYARFLLAFVLSLRRAARSTEVFAFNTELVRLTPWLARGTLGARLDRLAASVPDWSGGTRIGDCLARFVAEHLAARLDPRTVVVILSDGLDRGDPATLAAAMRAIQGRAREVIWLNPLLGDPRYAPTARGMEAALPFVDRFLPAHDLVSLERLVPLLSA
ncbi:MAG TPA: VWA domain-containing protein [Anaeromyxobacter sp.]|nr:VWA domain-containing protein [Anaeromyxobacter sp.]